MIEGRPAAAAKAIAGAIAEVRDRRGSASRFFPWSFSGLLRAWVAEEGEARRYFLWLPIFFGSGVLLYFAAEAEPSLWAPCCACALLSAFALGARRRGAVGAFRLCVAGAALFAGFSTATMKTRTVDAPALARGVTATTRAFVEAIDMRENGARLLLRVISIEGVSPAPVRVRVTMRARPDFEAGASIAATMRLLPPPQAAEPGGYDFSRDAFFQQLGAVGSISGGVARIEPVRVAGSPS